MPPKTEDPRPRKRSRKKCRDIIDFTVLYRLSERVDKDLKAEDTIIDTCNKVIEDPASSSEERLRAIEASAAILAERIKLAGDVLMEREKKNPKKEKPVPVVDYEDTIYG